MNKLLVRKKTFAPNGPQDADVISAQDIQDKKNLIFSIANSKRDENFTPIFVSDPAVLPVTSVNSDTSSVVVESVTDLKDVSEMTTPPQKGMYLSDLQKGIIVAVAAVVIIKILS